MAGPTLLRRWWQEILVVLAVCAAVAWILWPKIAAAWNAPAAQRELVAFTSELKLDMSQADVRTLFASVQREFLTLKEIDTNRTLVETPHRIGANDWLAWLDFTSGRLCSVRIRAADGSTLQHKPAGSPPDVGTPPPARGR